MALSDGSQEDYGKAAARHFLDAVRLREAGRLDNAGHLIGFAAECAIKHRIESLGPGSRSPEMHLPHILPAARKSLGKRESFVTMYDLLKGDIFVDWAVDNRYATDGKVTIQQLDNWIGISKRLLAAANVRVRLP